MAELGADVPASLFQAVPASPSCVLWDSLQGDCGMESFPYSCFKDSLCRRLVTLLPPPSQTSGQSVAQSEDQAVRGGPGRDPVSFLWCQKPPQKAARGEGSLPSSHRLSPPSGEPGQGLRQRPWAVCGSSVSSLPYTSQDNLSNLSFPCLSLLLAGRCLALCPSFKPAQGPPPPRSPGLDTFL